MQRARPFFSYMQQAFLAEINIPDNASYTDICLSDKSMNTQAMSGKRGTILKDDIIHVFLNII